jgi:hypothetical protein
MTITADRPAPQPAPTSDATTHREVSADWMWRAFLVALAAVGFAAHLYGIGSSYDLFIDESFYSQVGQSVANGHLPYATGSNFFLHPPGFFLFEAAWINVFGSHTDIFAQVYSLRKLVAVFAALNLLLVTVIIERLVGKRFAIIGGALYLVNAFVNRDTGFVILEPATIFWALSGYAVLMYLGPKESAKRRLQIVAVGLLFGMSVLSKEFAVFITVIPMALAMATRCWVTRREGTIIATLAALPFGAWVLIAAASGNWHSFYVQVSSGFRRSSGSSQISGFNRPGAPTFLDTIFANAAYLWTAYVILIIGSLAIIYQAVSRPLIAQHRFIAFFGVGALPLIIYCVLIGTNEEQFFNLLLAPALICLMVVVATQWDRLANALRVGLVVLALAAVVSDCVEYAVVHSTPDNGTYAIDVWMGNHVPEKTVVAVTNPVQREIFLRYTMVDDQNGGDLNADVRYLVVFYRQVDEGYAFVDRQTIDAQTNGLSPVFSTEDRSNGRMVIYAVN